MFHAGADQYQYPAIEMALVSRVHFVLIDKNTFGWITSQPILSITERCSTRVQFPGEL